MILFFTDIHKNMAFISNL